MTDQVCVVLEPIVLASLPKQIFHEKYMHSARHCYRILYFSSS